MKKPKTFSLVMLCLCAILSIVPMVNAISRSLHFLELKNIVLYISELLRVLTFAIPAVLTCMLIVSAKKNVNAHICIVLIACGVLQIASSLVKFYAYKGIITFDYGVIDESMLIVLGRLSECVIGAMMIVAATYIKKKKDTKLMLWLGWGIVVFGVYAFTSAFCGLSHGAIEAVPTVVDASVLIMMALAIRFLPKTLYDFDNCFLFNGKAFAMMLKIVGAIVLAVIIINACTSQSNPKKGNCWLCGGTGDSGSCIWCGGDGNSTWNP